MGLVRIPTATYRQQLWAGFDLHRATELVPYLDALGITDLYTSPVFEAMPGSTHGYDVVDHGRLNPELGSSEAFGALSAALHERDMGLVIDVVPNHMSIAGSANRWWLDVLENGPSSRFARHFDIDWQPPKPDLVAGVLLPFLGDQYGRVLESGAITVQYANGAFVARCHDLRLPVAPRSWPHILEPALENVQRELGLDHAHSLELESIVAGLSRLPPRTETQRARVRERYREKEILRRRLATLINQSVVVRAAIERSVEDINGRVGDRRSFDRLEALMADQGYRLSFWRVAADEINYRRFFDINELAAIRVEDPTVFAAVHRLVFRLARDGLIDGVRIDHVDGLLDPARYLSDLARGWRTALREGGRPEPAEQPPCYVVVEKILGEGERLHSDWQVHGTTGYEFLDASGGLFVDGRGLPALRALYGTFTGESLDFADVVYESKKLALEASMSSELTVLARKLDRISEQHRSTRDFTLNSQLAALAELVACFPVYRTYVRAEDRNIRDDDRAHIEEAVRRAKRRNPATSASIYDFLRSLLLLESPEGLSESDEAERRDFVLRFQQLTGPVMAKGLEDTSFYRYFPLASLNEVGGAPGRAPMDVATFHRWAAERQESSPHGLSASATHDTKRGEDVRARLSVLSEMPQEFTAAVDRWRAYNAPHRSNIGGVDAPDGNDEYFLYQSLLGVWTAGGAVADPTLRERLQAYTTKAIREAKRHTSWISPNEPYEHAIAGFVDALVDPVRSPAFLPDFEALWMRIVRPGYWNALARTVVKIAAPGVPDIYQGTELWDLSLVDPDNRRPVDYELRQRLLAELDRDAEQMGPALAERLLATPDDGRIKLFVTSRALRARRARAELMRQGRYVPCETRGALGTHVLAFARVHESEVLIAIVPRLTLRLGVDGAAPLGEALWRDTRIVLPPDVPIERLRDTMLPRVLPVASGSEGATLAVGEAFRHLPVALLEGS